MKEKKYIEFLKNVAFPKERENYFRNVKYHILDETNDNYIISKRNNITFSKSREGELFIIGRI